MISINLMLSAVIASALWCLAPLAATHIAHLDATMQTACLQSFRIGSVLLVVRSIDSVFTSTLRAFEQYGPTVRISMCSRLAALGGAVLLVARGRGVVEIMAATLCISTFAAAAQGWAVRTAAGKAMFMPSLHRETLRMIAGFGCFSWLQALSAVVFGQADRLVIGLLLGAPAVAAYALCDQAAQSIHGTVAAGFHVLFPHLSARIESEPIEEVRRTLWSAFKSNATLAVLLGALVVLLSKPILTLWMGHDFAQQAWPLLSILGAGSALLAMNVTAYYGLLAAGRIRLVMSVNLAAGAAMLMLMVLLTPHLGTVGTACGWLLPGPVTCFLYIPLCRAFRTKRVVSIAVLLENNQ